MSFFTTPLSFHPRPLPTPSLFWCVCGLTCLFASLEVDVAEEAFFQGDSYVEIDKAVFPHTSANTAETITVEFSTLEPNGILLWHGQKPESSGRGQDFVSLTGYYYYFPQKIEMN